MAERPAAIIQRFHLAFLSALPAKVPRERYALKGGANLRYYFGSARYSEDIDLDLSAHAGWNPQKSVDAVLRSTALRLLLANAGGLQIDLDGITRPKQTPTTRRWKVPILAPGHRQPVRTKIEFSARNGETRYETLAVPRAVVAPYAMTAPILQHYLAGPAVEQKVAALAGRPATQTRDVFDLDLLLTRDATLAAPVDVDLRRAAAERGAELTYASFADHVLPFLDPDLAPLYDELRWNQMQMHVVETLLAA